MTVCIYRPFRAFHWHSHSPTSENTSRCTANSSLRLLYASATESALCVLHSVCVCVCMCERMDSCRPKIACAPNYCCKHRCGKQGLPPPIPNQPSSTQHPVCSSLRGQEVQALCVCERERVCICMCKCVNVCEKRACIFTVHLCMCVFKSKSVCLWVTEWERVCVCIWASPDHTFWSRLHSALGFGHGHTAPPSAGWKPYTPHQSDLPLIHYS